MVLIFATCFDNDGTYFNSWVFSRFVVSIRDSLSLSFMSLNNTDVNFSCFKSFYENVSLDSLFIIIRKTFWSIEVLLTNYPTT